MYDLAVLTLILVVSIVCHCCFLVFLFKDETYKAKLKESNERSLALIKAAMDIVVAVGLLQLAPKKVTPRVTGAFGFVTSLISCYQVKHPFELCCVNCKHVLIALLYTMHFFLN